MSSTYRNCENCNAALRSSAVACTGCGMMVKRREGNSDLNNRNDGGREGARGDEEPSFTSVLSEVIFGSGDAGAVTPPRDTQQQQQQQQHQNVSANKKKEKEEEGMDNEPSFLDNFRSAALDIQEAVSGLQSSAEQLASQLIGDVNNMIFAEDHNPNNSSEEENLDAFVEKLAQSVSEWEQKCKDQNLALEQAMQELRDSEAILSAHEQEISSVRRWMQPINESVAELKRQITLIQRKRLFQVFRREPQSKAAFTIQRWYKKQQKKKDWRRIVASAMLSNKLQSGRDRIHLIDNYLQEERQYVLGLRALVFGFFRPFQLASEAANPIVSASTVRALFGECEALLYAHEAFLAELEYRWKQFPSENWGGLTPPFFRLATVLEAYGWQAGPAFVERAQRLLSQMSASSPGFAQLVKDCEESPWAYDHQLEDLVQLPCQRIPELFFFLRKLYELTDVEDLERDAIAEANLSVQLCAVHLFEEGKAPMTNRDKILALEARVEGGCGLLLRTGMKILKQGQLLNNKNQLLHVLLTDSFLFVAEPIQGSTKLRLLNPCWLFYLNCAVIQRCDAELAFEIQNGVPPPGPLGLELAPLAVLRCKSESELTMWIAELWKAAYGIDADEMMQEDKNRNEKEEAMRGAVVQQEKENKIVTVENVKKQQPQNSVEEEDKAAQKPEQAEDKAKEQSEESNNNNNNTSIISNSNDVESSASEIDDENDDRIGALGISSPRDDVGAVSNRISVDSDGSDGRHSQAPTETYPSNNDDDLSGSNKPSSSASSTTSSTSTIHVQSKPSARFEQVLAAPPVTWREIELISGVFARQWARGAAPEIVKCTWEGLMNYLASIKSEGDDDTIETVLITAPLFSTQYQLAQDLSRQLVGVDAAIRRRRILRVVEVWCRTLPLDFVAELDEATNDGDTNVNSNNSNNNNNNKPGGLVRDILLQIAIDADNTEPAASEALDCEDTLQKLRKRKAVISRPMVAKGNVNLIRLRYLVNEDPAAVAKQLTLLHHKMFCFVTRAEILKRGFYGDVDGSVDESAVDMMNGHARALRKWVIASLLRTSQLTERSKLLYSFLKLAGQLLHLGNFFGILEIVSALSSDPIKRLRQTFDKLAHEEASALKEIMALKDVEVYNGELEAAAPPAVPHLNMLSKSLVNLRNKQSFKKGDVYNIELLKMVAIALKPILKFQRTNYVFPEDEEMMALLNFPLEGGMPDLQMMDISLRLEPETEAAPTNDAEDNKSVVSPQGRQDKFKERAAQMRAQRQASASPIRERAAKVVEGGESVDSQELKGRFKERAAALRAKHAKE